MQQPHLYRRGRVYDWRRVLSWAGGAARRTQATGTAPCHRRSNPRPGGAAARHGRARGHRPVGDRRPVDISFRDAALYRESILRLPRHFGRGRYQGLTAAQAIAKADELDNASPGRESRKGRGQESEPVPRCGLKTVNKHLQNMHLFVAWLNAKLGWRLDDPFKGQMYSKKDVRRHGEARQRYDDDELRALFETPMFTGCFSSKRRARPGRAIIKDADYWVPLILMFTGARREEICQLYLADVIQVDGIWCFKIHDEEADQQTKNESSKRVVPIHETLIKLGLLDRVARLRKIAAARPEDRDAQRLFPELKGDANTASTATPCRSGG